MRYLFLVLLTLSLSVQSQIPNGYYSTATGTGYTLKSQLQEIIDGHTDKGYSALWDFYETYDVRNDGFVWDIYSNCDLEFGSDQDSGSGGTTECDKFNREHTFPQSWFNQQSPMRSDAVMVLPTDKKVNSERGSFPFAEVGSASYTSTNGSKKGSSATTGYSGTAFEPADEFKGDIARIYFYMATRYEDLVDGWESSAPEVLNGTTDQVYDDWVIDLMIGWHIDDPVSQKEVDRNDGVYNFQNNRNPFIDHPEWVECIWGDPCDEQTQPLASIDLNEVKLYPNPTSGVLRIDSSLKGYSISIVDVEGRNMEVKRSGNEIDVSELQPGLYFLRSSFDQKRFFKFLVR